MRVVTVTAVAMVAGFAFGLLVGQGTRKNLKSNVSAEVEGGVVVIRADVKQSVKDSVVNLF